MGKQNSIFSLIRIVNDALSADRKGKFARKFYFPYLHPHGIKEMLDFGHIETDNK